MIGHESCAEYVSFLDAYKYAHIRVYFLSTHVCIIHRNGMPKERRRHRNRYRTCELSRKFV